MSHLAVIAGPGPAIPIAALRLRNFILQIPPCIISLAISRVFQTLGQGLMFFSRCIA